MKISFDVYKIAECLEPSEEALQIDIRRIDPVWGNEISAHEYFKLAHTYYNEYRRLLTPKEVGVTLAHLGIYKRIIASNVGAIIFESDIAVSEQKFECLQDIITQLPLDFIHLGIHPNSLRGRYFWGRELEKPRGVSVASVHLGFHGAFAYYLTPRAAAMLVEIHENCLHRADDWVRLLPKMKLKAYHSPLFAHPVQRGALEEERKMLRLSLSLSKKVRKATFNDLYYRLKYEMIRIYARLFLSPIRGVERKKEESAEA